MDNYKPDSVEAAILAGLSSGTTKKVPARREQVVKDLLKWLASEPLSDAEAEALYTVIARRVRNAVCSKCLKLKAKFEGEVRDNKFVCRECRFAI